MNYIISIVVKGGVDRKGRVQYTHTRTTANTWDEVLTLGEEITGIVKASKQAQSQLTFREFYSIDTADASFTAEIADQRRPRR